jgi:hypothetical protein
MFPHLLPLIVFGRITGLNDFRSKVVNALFCLSISYLFGALFTGLRGAMFWISGTEPNIITCIHRQLSTKGFYYLDICNHVL